MALEAIPYRPGLVLDDTELSAVPYAVATEGIIWRNGQPEVMAGWQQLATGIQGLCRGMHEWATITGRACVAIGTDRKLYVFLEQRLIDITPLRLQATLGTNPAATTLGSTTVTITSASHGAIEGDGVYLYGLTPFNGVTLCGLSGTLAASSFQASIGTALVVVTHTAHGLVDNDIVFFSSATGLAGIPAGDINTSAGLRVQVLNPNQYKIQVATVATGTAAGGGTPTYAYAKFWRIARVASDSTFTIEYPLAATATGAGGGAAGNAQYDLTSGFADNVVQEGGFSAGNFGAGLYGVSEGTYAPQARPPRYWSMDNWGQELLACIVGGGVYRWQLNVSARAALLTNAPAQVNAIKVTAERVVLALGCTNTSGTFDPLCIRNCDIEAITTWTPSATNSARSFRIGAGSGIVGAVGGRGGVYCWTDASLYGIRYIGQFDQLYRADELGGGCGLLAPNACVAVDGDIYWMTPQANFYEYRGGRPDLMQCPISGWVQDNVERSQVVKVFAAFDYVDPAIQFFLPVLSGECDTMVRCDLPVYRSDPRAGWSKTTLARTAWCAGQVFNERKPLAIGPTGIIYQHNTGSTADGAPISWRLRWSPLAAGDGDKQVALTRLVVDCTRTDPFTVRYIARRWPDDTSWVRELVYSPTMVRCDLRVQGRQITLELEGQSRDQLRFGVFRSDVQETYR